MPTEGIFTVEIPSPASVLTLASALTFQMVMSRPAVMRRWPSAQYAQSRRGESWKNLLFAASVSVFQIIAVMSSDTVATILAAVGDHATARIVASCFRGVSSGASRLPLPNVRFGPCSRIWTTPSIITTSFERHGPAVSGRFTSSRESVPDSRTSTPAPQTL